MEESNVNTYIRSIPYRITDDEWACKLTVKRSSDGAVLIQQEIFGSTSKQAYDLAALVGDAAITTE